MLSIPDTPEFHQLLSSLSFSEQPSEICCVPEETAVYHNGKHAILPPLYLSTDPATKIKIHALGRKLMESWRNVGHPISEDLANSALGVFTALKNAYPDDRDLFNRILNGVVSADVSHYVVFLGRAASEEPNNFEGFRPGETQRLSLAYRSQKANSDFYQLYGDQLKSRPGLESPVFKRKVVGFLDHFHKAPLPRSCPLEQFHRVLLSYYEALSEIYLGQMWDDLDLKQCVGGAAGIEAFGVDRMKTAIGSERITIYLNQTTEKYDGYVVPTRGSTTINSWGHDPPILAQLTRFQKDLPTPISPTLTQVCRFGLGAQRHIEDSKWSDALLFFTIALELLFSEKSETSKAVTNRTAAVVSYVDTKSFLNSRKRLLALYDARSRFVHGGQLVDESAAKEMQELFVRVITVLRNVEISGHLDDDKQLREWIARLDLIAANHDANMTPSESIFRDCGLLIPMSEPEV